MSSLNSLTADVSIPEEQLKAAIEKVWRANRELKLADFLGASTIEDVRAFLHPPFNSLSIDTIRVQIHKRSKSGKMAKRVVLGEITLDEQRAENLERTNLTTMRKYLPKRRIEVSDSYTKFRESEQWRSMVSGLRRSHHWKCQSCRKDFGGRAMELNGHHWTYGDGSLAAFCDPMNVWLLCNGCHSVVHFLKDVADDPSQVEHTLFGENMESL